MTNDTMVHDESEWLMNASELMYCRTLKHVIRRLIGIDVNYNVRDYCRVQTVAQGQSYSSGLAEVHMFNTRIGSSIQYNDNGFHA